MAIDLSCRLIFLASPGGLDDERRTCRDTIGQRNEKDALTTKSTFMIEAWEDVPGGVGRPQDRINPRLDECDYAIFMLYDWWGTPPAEADSPFSSGTEEEFFRACELLEDADAPMRDILVLFKTLDPSKLRDPGESLKKVLQFRARLEQSKEIFFEVFDSEENLAMRVARKLRQWESALEEKVPKVIRLPQVDVDAPPSPNEGSEAILESARSFSEEGKLVQAEAAFSVAVQDEDPSALLEYAKFMRRTGRLEQASELNSQVVRQPEILRDRSPRATAMRVEAMANIGIIERKTGLLAQSVRTLAEAVATAAACREPIPNEHCYALDNYGHSLLAVGRPEQALEQFQAAASLRDQYGDIGERAQSAINLGRLHLHLSELEEALGQFRRASEMLESSAGADDHLVANAHAGSAEALILLGQLHEVPELLRRGLEANRRLNNRDGQSIIHLLWARYSFKAGGQSETQSHLDEAEELIEVTGNAQGRSALESLRQEVRSAATEGGGA